MEMVFVCLRVNLTIYFSLNICYYDLKACENISVLHVELYVCVFACVWMWMFSGRGRDKKRQKTEQLVT